MGLGLGLGLGRVVRGCLYGMAPLVADDGGV